MPTANIDYDTIDLLDRQPFVEQLMNVAQTLSENRKSACYAINGEWGVGKTFVLDMFEKTIRDIGQDGTVLSRYLVFHYNCWQYDYYEEPLIAIVAAMLDSIDEQVCLLSEKNREGIKEVLKLVGMNVLTKVNEKIEEKTGVDVKRIYELLDEIRQGTEKNYTGKHEFDPYFEFKKTIKSLSETIRTLSKEQTVVFVVDELDRCMPEYAIKVLERLHHVFENVPNVQVILSIDKSQLEQTVRVIFGNHVNLDRYLGKFIQFEIKLLPKDMNDNFEKRFSEYLQHFDYKSNTAVSAGFRDFFNLIFEGYDIRTRITLLDKCMLIHNLLFPEKATPDCSLMCVEVFLALVRECKIDIQHARDNFNIRWLFRGDNLYVDPTDRHLPLGLTKFMQICNQSKYFEKSNLQDTLINTKDIWGLLLGCYRIILGFEDDVWLTRCYNHEEYREYTKKYWNLLLSIC